MKNTVLALLLLIGCTSNEPADPPEKPAPETANGEGWQAFVDASRVFLHPRCLNCHPAGDRPLQTDRMTPHAMNVQRGAENRGRVGMRCMTCHQPQTVGGDNVPPGVPKWELAPVEMAFEGRTPEQLAKQFKDQAKAKGVSLEEFMHHVGEDPLVKWAWSPGEGRAPPPLSHAEFKARLQAWLAAGAPTSNKGG